MREVTNPLLINLLYLGLLSIDLLDDSKTDFRSTLAFCKVPSSDDFSALAQLELVQSFQLSIQNFRYDHLLSQL